MKKTHAHPHECLEGLTLKSEWTVVRRIERPPGASGGHFSCGYLVENPRGKKGYLKALDFYSRLPASKDPARALEPLLKAFNFERDLLALCRTRRLSRVVMALDDGAVTVPGMAGPATVQYIIFELADGDIRSQMKVADRLDVAWVLRSLHHIAVGLDQLHRIGVSHQDLKPSNVLLFDEERLSKLADLGRASHQGTEPPHYSFTVPGDQGYAPPEALYGAPLLSSEARRRGLDAYHLGSMIASLFTTVAMTPLIIMGLETKFHWRRWTGNYEDALLFLRPAFADAVDYVLAEVPEEYRREIGEALRQLCDPDPDHRGHPRDRAGIGSSYALHRYVSSFNKLARTAEYELTRAHDDDS